MNVVNYFSLSERVTDLIRQRILSGFYKPGERIKELVIAEELDISRGPVREAMKQLSEVGLVEHRAFKGNFVTTMDPREAWKIYVLRADLEVLSLKLVQNGLSDKIIQQLEETFQKMMCPEECDFLELINQDLKFHRLICEACDNVYLLKLWESLNGFIYSLIYTVHTTGIRDIHDLANRHTNLLDALKQKDLTKAMEEVTRHYLSTAEILVKHEGEGDLEKMASVLFDNFV